ncbi:MAG: hypothetical protein WA003_06895 [Desulfuromonadaceae bacterium]
MKSILFLQSVLFIVLLSGCTTLHEKFALSYDQPIPESYWTERNPPTTPLSAAEALAVESAAGLMTLKRVKGTAHYEGRDGSFAIIRHEKRISGEETYVSSVKYKIRNGFIFGETTPFVVAMHDPKKEAIAQEVAFEAARGSTPDIPTIYDGRIFVAKNNIYNSCTVDVVEKDLDREYTTYRIKTC